MRRVWIRILKEEERGTNLVGLGFRSTIIEKKIECMSSYFFRQK